MSLRLEGVGVHGGRRCVVRLHAEEGPVRFWRNGTEIPADLRAVRSTDRSTTLGVGSEHVTQVEHLLAALHVLGRWRDLLVEVSSDELPVLDGSARPWFQALEGLPGGGAPTFAYRPVEPTCVRVGEAWASVTPGARSLHVTIDFAHPAIGKQQWTGGRRRFGQLLDARTFGFAAEAIHLRRRGLALGSSLDNAIVFGEEGPLNALRSPDEPVRHKALDALGDLFLLGGPVEGNVRLSRGSHALHHAFMLALPLAPMRRGGTR